MIISHSDFITDVQPLADYRLSQGLRVQVLDVHDIYDEFNGGVFNPEAIRSFLQYTYAHWVEPAPSYVLLVGDGHYDYLDVEGYGETNFLPPYLDDVDPWIGETATDNRYVSLSEGDILPDMHIGRFPARTPLEAHAMVEKTIQYEQAALQDGWTAGLTFVADDPDGGGEFDDLSDAIIDDYIPSAFTVEKIYYDKKTGNPAAIRSALLAAINQGRLLVHYAGHASTMQWAGENFLDVSALASLSNGERLPFFLPMTCSEGYFVWPSPSGLSSLAESIVRMDGGGAIASWSPSGYGLSNGHDYLDRSVMGSIFNENRLQLGYMTTHAKYDLFANSSGYEDLIETYLLFGDPALLLKAPETSMLFLPLVSR